MVDHLPAYLNWRSAFFCLALGSPSKSNAETKNRPVSLREGQGFPAARVEIQARANVAIGRVLRSRSRIVTRGGERIRLQ